MPPVQSFDRTGARELDREAILRNSQHESARPAGGCGFRDEWKSGLGGCTVPSSERRVHPDEHDLQVPSSALPDRAFKVSATVRVMLVARACPRALQ
eukprot:14319292-Alexandrium_andersonii.AAC.1